MIRHFNFVSYVASETVSEPRRHRRVIEHVFYDSGQSQRCVAQRQLPVTYLNHRYSIYLLINSRVFR